MKIQDISLPEIYKSSSDFRFFCNWFEKALTRIQYDTENLFDLYDPLRCPSHLLWLLADTMGFKYDNRLPAAFNRLVLVYFMSMIRHKGSKDGVTLAAEVNLAQFGILKKAAGSHTTEAGIGTTPNDVLYNRLEDTSIPVNAVYVAPHPGDGYIDVVYYSDTRPIDACIEYVRPLGMYLFQHAGVGRNDIRTKISIDARLTNMNNLGMSIGPTHVGHYRRDDYARLQHMRGEQSQEVNTSDTRQPVYYRNSDFEKIPNSDIDPGYRSLYSLQLCNNEHIVEALVGPIFSLGYSPQDVETVYPDDYLSEADDPTWNLRYDLEQEQDYRALQDVHEDWKDISTIITDESTVTKPRPAVNPIMSKIGDAIAMPSETEGKTNYTRVQDDGTITLQDEDDA